MPSLSRQVAPTNMIGKAATYSTYITATSNVTGATYMGTPIDNSDRRINYIGGVVAVSNRSGTNPTIQLQLMGSIDANASPSSGTWVQVRDTSGNLIQTSAFSLTSASAANVLSRAIDSQEEGRTGFPFDKLAFRVVHTGTNVKWTGSVSASIVRGLY